MNPVIRELAIKAEGTKKHVPAVWQFYDSELQAFAESIVQECANVCNRIDFEYEGEDVLATWCSSAILKHFGVK